MQPEQRVKKQVAEWERKNCLAVARTGLEAPAKTPVNEKNYMSLEMATRMNMK